MPRLESRYWGSIAIVELAHLNLPAWLIWIQIATALLVNARALLLSFQSEEKSYGATQLHARSVLQSHKLLWRNLLLVNAGAI